MSGFNLKRKMKRTRQQELKVVESMNSQNIQNLSQNIQNLSQKLFAVAKALTDLQKNYLSLINVLKSRNMIDDLMLHRALGEIEEYERMQQMALKIDPNKGEPVIKEPGK